ncbi:hypothetical protein C0989_008700 [Termitomyces sp. Mn162]|nr:hypothetical protein C0989_008700 [Termitomyces sp. Mn162]
MAQPFASATTTGNVADNGDINITVTATRKIHIEADIISGSGELMHRKVNAALNNITLDEQSGTLAPITDHDISKTLVPPQTKFTHARLPGGRVVGL